jgi:hypothetical protein
MIEAGAGRALHEEFVDFRVAGERVDGAHRCSQCSYGIAVFDVLPRCPMCGGKTWEPSEWRTPTGTEHAGSAA